MQIARVRFGTSGCAVLVVAQLCKLAKAWKYLLRGIVSLAVFAPAMSISTTVTAQTTLEVRVSADNDDAEEDSSNGSMNLSSTDLELANDSATDTVGMRFTSVEVPRGVTITKAYIQFQVDEVNSDSVSLTIRGQNIDDAPEFTSGNYNISSRTTTTASVAWSPPAWNTLGQAGVDQRTADISSIIQEIIDRLGWSSGNDIVIIITGSGTRAAESHNGDSSAAALLHIEHDGDPPPAPTFYVRPDGNDSNAGDGPSAAQAWQTVSAAVDKTALTPGSIVNVMTGTYTGSITPSADGTSTQPIRFVADTDGTIFDASGDVTLAASSGNEAVDMDGDDYLEFVGFRIDGSNGGDFQQTVELDDSNGIVFERCEIIGADSDGLDAGNSSVTIINCLIYDSNRTGINVTSSSTVNVWNSVIAHNGGDGLAINSGTATVKNSIIAFNSGDGFDDNGGTINHTDNIVHGNSGNDFEGTTQDSSELTTSPQFADAANRDYHLEADSPAINAGTSAAGIVDDDYDGNSRPVFSAWDMGAFEYAQVGHWQLNDGTGSTASDSSGNSNDGTFDGGASWVAARCGWAAKLDGTNDWIDLGQIDLGTKAYTVSVWFKTSTRSQQTIFSATAASGTDHLMYVGINASGRIEFVHRSPAASSGGTTLAGTESITDNVWHHVVAVKSATHLKLYLDGVLIDSTGDTTSVHSSVNVVLARHGVSSSQRYFRGVLDEVRLYGTALSDSQVADLGGLVGRWRLDETAGTTAADNSVLGNSGSLSAGFSFDASAVSPAAVGDGLQFDGSDDYISVPNSASLQIASGITISAWVQGDAWGSGTDVNAIVRKGEVNPNNYQLAIADGRATLYLDDTDDEGYRGDTVLSTGQWYHVAATWDGTEVRIYLDGVMDHTLPFSKLAPIGTDLRALYIGGRSGTDLFDGALDEVRLYNRGLCADEIDEVYRSGRTRGIRIIKWVEIK